MRTCTGLGALLLLCGAAGATTYDLGFDWSDADNPFFVWSMREGTNLLPHVDAWQPGNGWSVDQPAWARHGVDSTRLPMFFRSNGSETFDHDWVEGDVVMHTTDSVNGVGSGVANVVFTVPVAGVMDVTGGVWMGRDIGRTVQWTMVLNGAPLTGGPLSSGDVYSSLDPCGFEEGSGGEVLTGMPVAAGDELILELATTSFFGDFIVIDMTVEIAPSRCPGDVDDDGLVNFDDLNLLLEAWGTSVSPGSGADLDGDGFVTFNDLNQVLESWGSSGC